MQKGDPEWVHPGTQAPTPAGEHKSTVPVQKPLPEWAQTVPTNPGAAVSKVDQKAEPAAPAEAPITEPPKAIAADALKSTWPPAAERATAPPEETDIWPPEPPTEKAMPAWPPPSELSDTDTPESPIPAWPPLPLSPTRPMASVPPAPLSASTPPAPLSASTPPAPPSPSTPPAPVPTLPVEVKPVTAPPPAPLPLSPAAAFQPAPPVQPSPLPPPVPATPPARQSGPTPTPQWAPAIPVEPKAAPGADVDWPAPVQIPSWAPRMVTESHPNLPQVAAQPTRPTPAVQKPAPPQPAPPQPAPAPSMTPSRPVSSTAPPPPSAQLPVAQIPPVPAPAESKGSSSWQVVEQQHKAAEAGPSPEDRSYAEWFAWAKRGGAPAGACHAAAQGAFAALSSGKDVMTAVQWATAAMSRPPAEVSYTRQTYCAWFSLANIDLNIDQQRSHAFATAAVHSLDSGSDAAAAHAAGLAAAGIR